jgi:hypothetical protein
VRGIVLVVVGAKKTPSFTAATRRLVELTLGHVFLLLRESARHPGLFFGACT